MNGRAVPSVDDLKLLEKVLLHEERTGFRDVSTAYGLSRFVGERVGTVDTGASVMDRSPVARLNILVKHYESLDPDQRRRAVADAREVIEMLLTDPALISLGSVEYAARPDDRAPHKVAMSSTVDRPATIRRAVRRIGSISDSVRLLPGVGEGRARQLELLGVSTIRDLIQLYPRRHVDYSHMQKIGSLLFGGICTIQGEVFSIEESRTRTGKQLIDVVVRDETGTIHAVWFNPYVAKALAPGTSISLSGRVEQIRGNLCLTSPEWELLDSEMLHTGRLTPIYPLTKNLYQKTLRPIVRSAIDAALPLLDEFLPDELLAQFELIGRRESVDWIHFPEGPTSEVAQARLAAARKRIAFDELLVLQLGLLRRKQAWEAQPGNSITIDRAAVSEFIDALPFALTGAQRRALSEILDGLSSPRPMTRMLQGDVGSGKTVVAAATMYAATRDGYQTAIMAPTEILAEQHYRGLTALFAASPPDVRPQISLLTGSVTGRQRAEVYDGISSGEVGIVVGTHALIQLEVDFARLGFVVIDEQHRFGVEQRGTLRSKGTNVDVLVVTATPIPRTLALTMHGDLDISTLDELPPGRQAIETYWVKGGQRARAYRFIREQVDLGRQAFIIVPLVEESEAVDAKAAVAEYDRLGREVFPDISLGLLHGRMKPAEKDAMMTRFRDGDIAILVATSVVEVGIDVPNATVMLVDGAERFGLAQLHQFRGRVGRGSEKSYCLLLADDVNEEGRRRLQALVDSQDGFHLAQVDLELRGPGDFLGTRQSGLPELSISSFADVRDLERARTAAEAVLADDPQLSSAKYALLAARVDAFWAATVADVS